MVMVTVLSVGEMFSFKADMPAVPRLGEVVVVTSNDPENRERFVVTDVSHHASGPEGAWEISVMVSKNP
jgi:hypothetical protein